MCPYSFCPIGNTQRSVSDSPGLTMIAGSMKNEQSDVKSHREKSIVCDRLRSAAITVRCGGIDPPLFDVTCGTVRCSPNPNNTRSRPPVFWMMQLALSSAIRIVRSTTSCGDSRHCLTVSSSIVNAFSLLAMNCAHCEALSAAALPALICHAAITTATTAPIAAIAHCTTHPKLSLSFIESGSICIASVGESASRLLFSRESKTIAIPGRLNLLQMVKKGCARGE
ncbi:hypothetical protein Mal33_24700 [Rosistilla oblonga]|uniref:Uncharacterized protein n=1 Tax=Rosistilla oblonga TaxID=2527990 RepID=A0A518ITU2_9BACT|nr:hypothetical protein Mal33_24700 [Rosistilla oblonga]